MIHLSTAIFTRQPLCSQQRLPIRMAPLLAPAHGKSRGSAFLFIATGTVGQKSGAGRFPNTAIALLLPADKRTKHRCNHLFLSWTYAGKSGIEGGCTSRSPAAMRQWMLCSLSPERERKQKKECTMIRHESGRMTTSWYSRRIGPLSGVMLPLQAGVFLFFIYFWRRKLDLPTPYFCLLSYYCMYIHKELICQCDR